MRIYFSSMTLPKKAAKRIQKHFTPEFPNFGSPMSLHEAQMLAAVMLGYDDWHELEQCTKSGLHPPSLLDEQASPEEQKRRIAYQMKILGRILPVTEPILREVALKLRVSAATPTSIGFAEDGYRQNSLFYWEPSGENPEWRFRPSARSREVRDELYDLAEQWERRTIGFDAYLQQLEQFIGTQPENVVPYLYIIDSAREIDAWEVTERYLPKLESAILGSLPADYPMKRKVPPLNWGTMENRDYLRSLYHLALGYYANRDYKKAKQWFLFLTRCCAIEIGYEKLFLVDLRQASPDGDLHLLDEEELFAR